MLYINYLFFFALNIKIYFINHDHYHYALFKLFSLFNLLLSNNNNYLKKLYLILIYNCFENGLIIYLKIIFTFEFATTSTLEKYNKCAQ